MPGEDLSRQELNRKTGEIVDAAMKVHATLGPGLLESAYHACLVHELRRRGFDVSEQVGISLEYEDLRVPVAYRADVIVDDAVVVELKCVAKLIDTHEAQLQTHLNLGEFRVGLLFNFRELHLRNGIRRRVNHF